MKIVELEKENTNIESAMQGYSDGIKHLQQEVKDLSETMTSHKVELASVDQKKHAHQLMEIKRLSVSVTQGRSEKTKKETELKVLFDEKKEKT